MEYGTRLSIQSIRVENKSFIRGACKRFFNLFSLNGHFSYAFIYGSWEIIRARRVGTTHTKVDYVVYRLFYPVILIAACLFAVVAESDLAKFFSLVEVWCMILHISYSFIFLQNVLTNNLHRDNVRHRQKIPERLVVTDEIEKGGHKFYICKRYSILPTEKLYYSERFIWLIFNILASTNVSIMLGHFTGQIRIHSATSSNVNKDLEDIRAYSMGILILLDVFLTPIPMRVAHVIFPVAGFFIYHMFLILHYEKSGWILYDSFDVDNITTESLYLRAGFKLGVLITCHLGLTGVVALRDYAISLLDDSHTPKQIQSLRSQKRLARRKLMNYVEGDDGRIIGISLEKHNYVPGIDEYIKTAKAQKRRSRVAAFDEESVKNGSDEGELGEITMFRKQDGGGDEIVSGSVQVLKDKDTANVVPLTANPKEPPKPRYITPVPEEEKFSSSSSSTEEDELEAIRKSIKRLPTPPKDSDQDDTSRDMERNKRKSRIPVPIHNFGVLVKPRDSKENIHHKMDTTDESPPTPPFVRLVQTLIKVQKEAKGEVEQQRKMQEKYGAYDGNTIKTRTGTALVKVVRSNQSREDKRLTKVREPRVSVQKAQRQREKKQKKKARFADENNQDSLIDKLISDAVKPTIPGIGKSEIHTGRTPESDGTSKMSHATLGSGKPVASKVIHVKDRDPQKTPDKKVAGDYSGSEFHKELSEKLQKEKNKLEGKKEDAKKKLKKQKKKRNKLKSILKPHDLDDEGGLKLLTARSKRRETRLKRRREERAVMGKHGLPMYDALTVPQNVGRTSTTTTFHYLSTKLKGEKVERTTVPAADIPLYRRHPGIGTTDEEDMGDGKATKPPEKSVVAFHPIVKYFDVNEVEPDEDKKSTRSPRQARSRWAK